MNAKHVDATSTTTLTTSKFKQHHVNAYFFFFQLTTPPLKSTAIIRKEMAKMTDAVHFQSFRNGLIQLQKPLLVKSAKKIVLSRNPDLRTITTVPLNLSKTTKFPSNFQKRDGEARLAKISLTNYYVTSFLD